jgi:trigger factor
MNSQMQVQIETVGALERRMTVKIPAQRVEDEVESRLKSLSRTARIKGFRPGKVPFKVVVQNYGPQVRSEVLDELLRRSYGEALVQQKLNPAGGPRIEPVSAEPGADVEFVAVFEVYPTVKLAGVDSIKVEKPAATITDADVETMVDNLRRQRGAWKAVARAAKDGDRVTVDFEGSLDGQPFAGGKGERMPIVLGAGRMVPGFEAQLAGLKAGDEKSIDIRFPSDYPTAQLAGRDAKFAIRCHEVAELEVPALDASFAKAFGVADGTVETLRKEVRDNMQRELDETVKRRLKEQVMQALLDANQVELPRSLVDEEIARLSNDALARMGMTDRSRAPDLPREMFEEQARRRVKLGLLVGAVLQDHKIKLEEARVQRVLDDLTAEYGDRAAALAAYRGNRDVMRQIETLALEEQAVEFLVGKAKVTEKATTFAELMNFAGDKR